MESFELNENENMVDNTTFEKELENLPGESIKFKEEFNGNCIRTLKDVSSEYESLNARLLVQGGFINQELAGVYSYTRLGYEVLDNIEEIIRKHMRNLGNELRLPALQPVENWQTTSRLENVSSLFEARGGNELSQKNNSGRYVLGPTHEEVITPFAKRYIHSYRDFPVSFFQFQTKFRNEARPKSGLLRGREFLMKDMYSFHQNRQDLELFYERVKEEYVNLFDDLGLGEDTFFTYASGGDFTDGFSHEFQTLLPNGEDTIYIDRKNNVAYNKEIVNQENAIRLGVNFSDLEQAPACEVANIFPLNTKYSKPFNLTYTDSDGSNKLVYMGCYGIGVSRLMGVIAEKFADERGLVWPENIAPAKYHIVTLAKDEEEQSFKLSKEIFNVIGKDSLWDARKRVSSGEKLKDADLIGCPYRLLVSARSIKNGGVEVENRKTKERKIVSIAELMDRLTLSNNK